MRRLAPILALWSCLAWAQEVAVGGHVTAELQLDSNPTRAFNGDAVVAPGWTPALFGAGVVSGALRGADLGAQATYEVGARHYLAALPVPMDTLTQQLSVAGTLTLNPALFVQVTGSARDRRGKAPYTDGERPYSDLRALGFLGIRLGPRASVELGAGAERFLLWDPDPAVAGYSFGSPLLRAQAHYALDRRHAFEVVLSDEPRAYDARAVPPPGAAPSMSRRQDSVVGVTVAYRYRGPVLLQASYGFIEQDSNSFGQSSVRHLVSASAGVRLPLGLSLLGRGTLQLASYPEGIALTQVLLTEDAENTNAVSLELARALTAHLDAQVRYGYYGASLRQNGFAYARQLVSAGVTWTF